MHATEVIEAYIDDIVRLLPRRQRDDVAAELRTLLNEELHARAQELGRPPDEALALSLVRGYGRPNEVAARYQPPWVIIDPADSTSFLRAAIIGAGALVLLGAMGKRLPSPPGTAQNLVKIGILDWLGLLVVAFGAKNWIRRRSPATVLWEPRDRDRVNRVGTAVVVPIATFFVVLYGAPTWVLDQISGGRLDTSWAAYTAEFQRLRLPCFIGLMVGLLALLSFVAIEGRWSRLTRRINIGLNMAFACLILSFAVDGNIFQSSLVDQIARNVLALIALIYVLSVGVQLYGEIGRHDRAAATKKA
ncbi:MAG TPA: hypothetical protein VGZ22_18535 [Isosphaeraceae bacterium]|jgi:hypothetical protein|nr:hypothetical protein [Isosphaeraceae bacterium]